METLRARDRILHVLFDRKHRNRFSLSVFSAVVGDCPMANMINEQEISPCLWLCPDLSFLEEEGTLVLWLAPALR